MKECTIGFAYCRYYYSGSCRRIPSCLAVEAGRNFDPATDVITQMQEVMERMQKQISELQDDVSRLYRKTDEE